jgi:hypothetical protein
MKTNKKNKKTFRKIKRRKTIKRKSKIRKMYGGNLISIDEIEAQLPKTWDFSDLSCGTFERHKRQIFDTSKYPEGAVKGKYTSSNRKEIEDIFFYVTKFKYKYHEFGEEHIYTGYASLNPKGGKSSELQKYFQQIQGINYYPNGDICIGCFFRNSPDGHAKYYKYMGDDQQGKKQYRLEYDGQWNYSRYHEEPSSLQELTKAAFIKSNKGSVDGATQYVLDSIVSMKPDIQYHISDQR